MKPTSMWGELLAELIGTAVILLFGAGVCAMVVLFGRGVPGEVVHGGYTNITIGWGIGVSMGIYVAGRVSGAHLNPAVTLALALFRGFPFRKVIPYSLAQTAGGFIGAALVFLNYREQFLKADPQLERTAGIFTTFPAFPGLPQVGFFDQVLGTALLLLFVLAVTDERNHKIPAGIVPLVVGLIVVGIGVSFGALHGYAINPARDFGPRLFVTLAGFRNNGLIDGTHIYWVPIVGPMVGGVLGAALYDKAIRRYLPD